MKPDEFHKQNTLPNLTAKESKSPIPKKIGPYKIDTLLSKGGMSYLYLGLHPEKEIPLVVKVLSPRYMTHPEMVNQFLKESQIIGMTDHPNIITLYGQGEWEQGLYIAMEFVQGISLKQFIIQQNLSIRSALEIILQVSYALLHLHTHGVIHRDLKPENVLITETGQVKVIDFGIAQLTFESKGAFTGGKGRVIGTLSYMSPEQKENPLDVTVSTDIYSLGVLAYELIVGKLSYGSIQLSLLPKELQKIVEKALQPAIHDRYQDIVDFITDISEYLKNHPIKTSLQGEEEVKEIWKTLEERHLELLPQSTPKWPHFEIGFAHPKKAFSLGSYYDFFRFADQSYLIIMGELNENQVHSLAYVGLLKGIIQTLTRKFLNETTDKFQPIIFITDLNEILSSYGKKQNFAFAALYLTPLEDQFSYISCGFAPLLHLPNATGKPRFLNNNNPLLGLDPNHGFYETTDNWAESDLLLFHSFNTKIASKEEVPNLDTTIQTILSTHLQLSAQNQADNLLKDLSTEGKILLDKYPKSVMTIQRLT